jgi:hydrogenase expression/formation protein HypE
MMGAEMSDSAIPAGKLPSELLGRLLAELGPMPPSVLIGPAVGEDACAIDVGTGALVAASDPITFAGSEVGRTAVIVNANDVAVMGARPQWFLATVLLPEGTSQHAVESLFDEMCRALDQVGAHLVGGHTEVTSAVRRPVVVGHMLGVAAGGRVLTSAGVSPGDAIVQIGPVPVEGAAVLAQLASASGVDVRPTVLRAAAAATDDPGLSVVEAALDAAELGANAMHDLTEGGLAGGLWDLAVAARVALHVDGDAVAWFEPGRELCRALGADPWTTLASGSLLAAFRQAGVGHAVERLRVNGHQACVIAVAGSGQGVYDRAGRLMDRPGRDEVARLLAAMPQSASPDMAPGT